MTRDPTEAYLQEWGYRFTERLGMLCEDRDPTQAEIDIAKKEADEWLTAELEREDVIYV